ncbi:tyrosine-type recombinase/integrase, partial [Phenylobacterium sp.]|uniref:tyrosine-type recombinase/integrase n=1 Tax=Phenylobacterium sp. TaxID=1871053 RepID=UPI0030F47FC0
LKAPAAAEAFRALTATPTRGAFLSHLITRFLTPEAGQDKPAHLANLADRTWRDLRKALDVVRADLGETEIVALNAKGARRFLIDWRDRYAATPKTADTRLEALAKVIAWAHERDELTQNALKPLPRLYRVNRAEAVWTKPDLVALLKGAPADFRRAVLLAVFTGLRLADVVKVGWQDVGDDAITFRTGKSRGRRIIVIPITPKLRAVLKQIGPKDVGAILTSSRGTPWAGSGLQTAMQREKTAKGITGLRLHDLRGTAATHFIRAGLPVADVALIVGWDRDRTAALASYVTAEAVAGGMLERIRQSRRSR